MSNDLIIAAHKDREHSPTGGSSIKRVMNCTASVELCEKYPNVESDFAAEGTALHEAIDLIFQGKTDKDIDVVGLTFNGIELTNQLYIDGIREAVKSFDALDQELGGIDFLPEVRVVFPGIEGSFGTADIVGRAKDRSVVLDWKFGRGVAVDAHQNEQLMYYAYAAAHTPATAKLFDKNTPIELFIVQPMINDGEPFTRWLTSWMQLEAFAAQLRRAVDIAYSSEATFKLGDWCKFCNAKMGCPLYQNKIEELGALSRGQLEAQLSQYLPWADVMITFGEDVKKLAHALMEQGAEVEGYKLVAKRANRSWKDEAKTIKYFSKVGLPAADRYVKALLSPAQAEAALKKARLPAELPASLVDKVSSGTTLAPITDKRPAVPVVSGSLRLLAERLSAR